MLTLLFLLGLGLVTDITVAAALLGPAGLVILVCLFLLGIRRKK